MKEQTPMKVALSIFAALAFSVSAAAQSGGQADVFAADQIKAKIAGLSAHVDANGSAGAKLADYGSHKVQISLRTASGGAEIHAHFDDVMIVQQGSATLITGGTVIDPKSNADGETKGTSIQGGKSQTIGVGDIVTVNAGVPHQLIIPAGTTYAAVVIKIKE
jgi:mannose-6-phosphate isomerase-like protein (cupin superfamily)